MATYLVRDRSGATLEVSSKEQADAWVAVGYQVVSDEKPRPSRRAAATKKAAEKSSDEK